MLLEVVATFYSLTEQRVWTKQDRATVPPLRARMEGKVWHTVVLVEPYIGILGKHITSHLLPPASQHNSSH